MATSLIQFTQGATTGTAGQALTVTTGTAVSIANNSNTGVASWQIDLVDVPSGSSLSTGTLAHSDNGATPSASFTPDVTGGCYRIALYVWTAINRVGTAQDTDIRNAVVLDVRGFASPPSQIWPSPLPPTASGLPGNKPNELNLGGQERGYAGTGTDGLLDQRFAYPVLTNVNISAGTTSNKLSAFAFSNSNNVSFGLNGSTITATVTVTYPTQTNQTIGLYGLGNTTQNSSTTFDARTLSFNGLGIVSVGYSNGSIQISATTAAQSAQTQNVVVPSAGTQTATSGTVIWSNSNGISFGMSGSSRITASYTVPSIAGLISAINISAGTTSNNLTAVSFNNGNNVSFGLNGSVITGSVATSLTNINLSAGTTSNNLSAFVFSNSNNVSFGLNGSTVTATITVPAQTNQSVGLYALGNTTQNSSTTLDARTLSFNGLGGITVGYSNGSIQVSGPQTVAQTVQTQNVVVPTAGTQTATSGTIAFVNSNGITFGMSGSSAITASYTVPAVPAQTNQTIGLYALGNTTQNSSTTLDARTLSFNGLGAATIGYSNGSIQVSVPVQTAQTQSLIQAIYDGAASISTGTIRFSNLNGVTFGINAQTITASVAAQSVQTVGLYALGNTTQNSSTTLDARTISYNGLGIVTVGYSNGSVQISATTAAQTNQTLGLYAVGNSTQNSSTTLDARTLSFNGAGIASIGYSNGSVIISVPPGAPSPVNFSAGTTSGNLGSVVFANSNGVSFGLNGSTITASAAGGGQTTAGFYALGNTTQNSSTTFPLNSLSFNGIGAMTVGYSNGSIQMSAPATSSLVGVGGVVISTNGNTISVSGPGLTNYEPQALVNTATFSPGQNTWYLEPFELPGNMSGGRINQIYNFSNGSVSGSNMFVITNSASFGTATSGTISNGYTFIKNLALYSLDAGTNSTRLASFWSNSNSFAISRTMSISQAGGTAISVSLGISMSYVSAIDSNGSYTTVQLTSSASKSTASAAMNTTAVSSFYSSYYNMLSSGNIIFPVGLNTTINPGNYWLGMMQSTSSQTGGTSLGLFVTSNMINYTLPTATAYKVWGQTATANSALAVGAGSYSATSAAPPTTIGFTQVNTLATRQYIHFLNSTL